MKKILVAYEGMVQSKTLKIAKDMAKDSKAELTVIRVIPYEAAGTSPQTENSIKAFGVSAETYKATKAKNAIKKETAEGLESIGMENCKVIVKVGEPASEIVNAADEQNADLLIIGSRRLAQAGEVRLGAITERVIRYANKPVLVVK